MKAEALAVFLGAVFVNNILLTRFLGLCPYLARSGEVETAFGLGTAVAAVTALATPLNLALHRYLLVPLGLEHLGYLVFILVIAALVHLVEILLERVSPALHAALGVFLPLITVNCAVFGTTLFALDRHCSLLSGAAFGLGSGLGWMLAILLLAGLRERLAASDVPEPLEGVAITMMVTGVMAMAFAGFAGMGG